MLGVLFNQLSDLNFTLTFFLLQSKQLFFLLLILLWLRLNSFFFACYICGRLGLGLDRLRLCQGLCEVWLHLASEWVRPFCDVIAEVRPVATLFSLGQLEGDVVDQEGDVRAGYIDLLRKCLTQAHDAVDTLLHLAVSDLDEDFISRECVANIFFFVALNVNVEEHELWLLNERVF